MPVEFLTDEQAAAYGRYVGPVLRVDLDRYFFLDDEWALIESKRPRGQPPRVRGAAVYRPLLGYLPH